MRIAGLDDDRISNRKVRGVARVSWDLLRGWGLATIAAVINERVTEVSHSFATETEALLNLECNAALVAVEFRGRLRTEEAATVGALAVPRCPDSVLLLGRVAWVAVLIRDHPAGQVAVGIDPIEMTTTKRTTMMRKSEKACVDHRVSRSEVQA